MTNLENPSLQNSKEGGNQKYLPLNNKPETPDQPQQEVAVRFPKMVPYTTYSIIGLTIFIFVLQMLSVFLLGGDLPAVILLKSNKAIQAGQLWRLITPVLLHDNSSLLHIGSNMYALFALGPSLERFYGHFRFLVLYLVAGLAGTLASFIFTTSNSLGASTSIFGLIAAELVFVYLNREFFGSRFRSVLINMLVIIGINLGLGFVPGIDMFGHLGGLVGGLVFAWFAGPLLSVEQIGSEFVMRNRRSEFQFWSTSVIETSCLLFIAALVIFMRR